MNAKENLIRTLTVDHPQWVPDMLKDFRYLIGQAEIGEMEENDYDWFGVHWTSSADGPGMPAPTPGREVLTDITDWKNTVKFPDLDAVDWDFIAEKWGVLKDRDTVANYYLIPQGIFERTHALMGFEQALIALYEEPEAYEELVEAITCYKIKLYQKLIDHMGADAIAHSDDFGTQISTFISPAIFRRLFKPRLKRIADAIHEKGCIAIMHSCGKVDTLVDDFVECGFDGWEPCMVCNDLDSLVEKHGQHFSFSGGLNAQALNVPSTAEEDIREELQRRIGQLGRFGGYVPAYVLLEPRFYEVCSKELKKYKVK